MLELRGITWDHPRGLQPLEASVAPYEERFGVRVHWEARSLRSFGDQPVDQLARRYDVLIIDHPHSGLAAATGCLWRLEQLLEPGVLQTQARQSVGPSFPSYRFEDGQWALPVDAAAQTAAFRPDLLEAHPRTWPEVLALARQVRAEGRFVGVPLCPTDAVCSFMTLCASFGEAVGQTPGRLVRPEVGLEALDYLQRLGELAHPRSLEWNPIALLDRMSTGGELVYTPLTFGYSNYAREGFRARRLRFADLPGVRGALLGGTGFAVSAYCRHPEAAALYGAWLCSAEVQRGLYVEHGGQPGNRVAWDDEHANRITHGFFRDTLASLGAAHVRPRHHGFVAFQEGAGERIHAMLCDRTSAQACLSDLEALYREHGG